MTTYGSCPDCGQHLGHVDGCPRCAPSPRDAARAACPPGRPRALFTLDELRARRRNSLELDRLCGRFADQDAVARAIEAGADPVDVLSDYAQEHDGHAPSKAHHNSDYGAFPGGCGPACARLRGAPHTHGGPACPLCLLAGASHGCAVDRCPMRPCSVCGGCCVAHFGEHSAEEYVCDVPEHWR